MVQFNLFLWGYFMLVSAISKAKIKANEAVYARDIKPGIVALIQSEYPDFNEDSVISLTELGQFRRRYLTQLVAEQKGQLEAVDLEIMAAIHNNSILSENIEDELEIKLTFGERVSDKIAEFGGSWKFILSFFAFLLIWMLINVLLASKAFDVYPFILLNLMLSCLAAIQAPIIMMSQNRQEQKDRKRAENDYKVNLKAEIEIRLLNDKIDYLLRNQQSKLLEIQEIQSDYLADLLSHIETEKGLRS